MNTRNPRGMGDLDAAAYRLAGSISARIGAQVKTAPGARCVNSEQWSQGLANAEKER